MKISAFLVLLVFGASMFVTTRPAASRLPQTPQMSELEKLEAQLKDLEQEAGTVKVSSKSDGKIVVLEKFSEELVAAKVAGAKDVSDVSDSMSKLSTRTVLEIDLSKIEVSDEYIEKKFAAASSKNRPAACPAVDLRQVRATPIYEVVTDCVYDSGGYRMIAWQGFKFDRASIPRAFWAIIDKDSLSNTAPLFHDLLYSHAGELPANRVSPYKKFTRDEADELFKILMQRCGVNSLRVELAYRAVKYFAKSSWKKRHNGDPS